MEAERKRVANELRSTGSAESEKIRADADRQREVILAQAYRDAQRIKGEGDAKATAIHARAYEANPEFYAFYRSIEAYKQSFKSKRKKRSSKHSANYLTSATRSARLRKTKCSRNIVLKTPIKISSSRICAARSRI